MKLKQVTKCLKDGQLDSRLYLVDKSDNSSSDRSNDKDALIYDLGSLSNGGLTRLIELGNAIHQFLIDPAREYGFDCILASKKFGAYYLVDKLLDRLKVCPEANSSNDYPTSTSLAKKLLNVLVTALLESTYRQDTCLELITSELYKPFDIDLVAEDVRSVVRAFQNEISKSGELDYIVPNICGIKDEDPELSVLKLRLYEWSVSDHGAWFKFDGSEGIDRLSRLTLYLKRMVEDFTSVGWAEVRQHLSELHAVEIDQNGKTIHLTTRPTAIQLGIFYRLKLVPPPLMFSDNIGNESRHLESSSCISGRSMMHEFDELAMQML